VGYLLRGDSAFDSSDHPAPTENLFVLAAGRWSGDSLGVLSNGATQSLFETLRSQFDFVLVDGSPILPVADTRVISRHVDGVLLSILRDVSRGPKVLAACEILDAFGVRLLGAVMTGSATDAYYGDLQYAEDLPG